MIIIETVQYTGDDGKVHIQEYISGMFYVKIGRSMFGNYYHDDGSISRDVSATDLKQSLGITSYTTQIDAAHYYNNPSYYATDEPWAVN
jgi:hypothetical protein